MAQENISSTNLTKSERVYKRHCKNYKTTDFYTLKYTFYVSKKENVSPSDVIVGYATKKNVCPITTARGIKFLESEFLDNNRKKTIENIKKDKIKTFKISKKNFNNVDISKLPFDVNEITDTFFIQDEDNIKTCYNFLKKYKCLQPNGRFVIRQGI